MEYLHIFNQGYQAQLDKLGIDKLGFSMQALKAPLTRISGMFKSFTSPTVTNPSTNAIAMKQPLTQKVRNAFTPQPKNPIIFEGESPSSPAFKAMLQRRGNPSEARVSGKEMHNKIQSYLQRLPQAPSSQQSHGWVNKPTTTTPSMMFGATRPSIPQPTMATKIGANQSMTSKEIAAHVLEKVAVSRWREAIYSGELPTQEAERLKQYMGVDPDAYAASLQRGAEAHLKARGKDYERLKPDAMFKNIEAWQKAQLGGGALTEATGRVIHDPLGNVVTSSLLTSGQGSIPDRIKGLVNAPVTKSRFKQHGALIARHEADESSFINPKTQMLDSDTLNSIQNKFNKKYIVQKPATPTTKTVAATLGSLKGLTSSLGVDVPKNVQLDLNNPQARTNTGNHMNPKVVLNEIRNSRMLQPSAEKFNTQIRKVTGELDQIPHMSKGIDDVHNRERPRIDKKNMNRMARAMQDASRYNINEHLRESDKWKGIVEKYKPMIEKVRDTGMELIPKITRMSNRGEGLLRKIRDFRFR